LGEEPDLERDAGLVAAVDGEIDGVMAGFFEFELLDIDDEISRQEIAFGWETDIGGEFDAGHDGASVFVDQIHADAVLAFFDAAKDHAKRDGALGMDSWELVGDDGVEGAEEIEFSSVIGCRVAEHGDLNVHNCCSGQAVWSARVARSDAEEGAQSNEKGWERVGRGR
jgi:hypothetical protein